LAMDEQPIIPNLILDFILLSEPIKNSHYIN